MASYFNLTLDTLAPIISAFSINNGAAVTYSAEIDKKSPDLAKFWYANTTNPRGPGETVNTSGVSGEGAAGEGASPASQYYGRTDDNNGADTDGDGVPDGWELYIMAGPKANGAYVFAPPYAGFTTAFGGEASDSFWSPFVAAASTSDSYNPLYVMESGVIDTLSELREFSSTDACAYYAKYSTTILPPARRNVLPLMLYVAPERTVNGAITEKSSS